MILNTHGLRPFVLNISLHYSFCTNSSWCNFKCKLFLCSAIFHWNVWIICWRRKGNSSRRDPICQCNGDLNARCLFIKKKADREKRGFSFPSSVLETEKNREITVAKIDPGQLVIGNNSLLCLTLTTFFFAHFEK